MQHTDFNEASLEEFHLNYPSLIGHIRERKGIPRV